MAERYTSLFSQDYDLIDIRKQTYLFYPSQHFSTLQLHRRSSYEQMFPMK